MYWFHKHKGRGFTAQPASSTYTVRYDKYSADHSQLPRGGSTLGHGGMCPQTCPQIHLFVAPRLKSSLTVLT